ncbi:vacuolar import and degradation protein-domain-containing protein [Massariosphaeria phaeospora]|uniref:Vacuolar import and degradation protein-domain-containing protein n=1 Tax=Massariosphaeria phaeospora TaxID=100035 RepID=A0A7C8I391_9PLEO|nr:vacuolar import and degradation protein-domain-containing protein [Massariosphaeria phaeospora]
MPTPDDAMLSPPAEYESHITGRTTCPPDDLRIYTNDGAATEHPLHEDDNVEPTFTAPAQQPTPPPGEQDGEQDAPPGALSPADSFSKMSGTDIETPTRGPLTPSSSAADESADEQRNLQVSSLSITTPPPSAWTQPSAFSSPFPNHRFLPHSSSSRLRPGSRFKGSQTSDRQQYEVEVEIKYVDMRESFLCGYLRIKGLTEDHPSLTTYFEGEIIGSKYSFITQHPEWGSNEKVDRQHWARFQSYKPVSKFSSRQELITKEWNQKEHLFMRWKEHFLVPDHRVRTINGASFEGFYYICFDQVCGSIEGIYFHAKSEKFQKLRLEHVEDRGCQGAIEFR